MKKSIICVRAPAVTGLAALLFFAACDREAGPPAPPSGDGLTPTAQSEHDPIRVLYLCGNRFVVLNEHPFPVPVSWRIQGTDEHGELTLKAAPDGDPAMSEVEISAQQAGNLVLLRDNAVLAVREHEHQGCEAAVGPPSLAIAGSSTAGSWTAPAPWPIVAVHLHLLLNGKVLAWGKFGDPYVWNPSNNTFTAYPLGTNLFCSGHATLANGKLFVAGGHISDNHGLPDANTFDPKTNAWTKLPAMKWGRWYPTVTELPSGEMVVMGGKDQNGQLVQNTEVWNGTSWRSLTALRLLPMYPRNFLAPNGRVFYAGELRRTLYLNTSNNGSWSVVGDRLFGTRDYGAAVMYEPGKILYVGGGRTTATAETIDLNAASPSWKWTGSMAYPRRHLNATMLPTGEVLVTGGVRGTSFNEISLGVRVAEIWNPQTGVWSQLASNAVNRGYHATSILLPDGRVLHAGSGDGLDPNGKPYPPERNGELFSPPYLFKGARPVVSGLSTSTPAYSTTMTVSTPTPSAITKVSLIAIGSATHAFDYNQRFMWLTFTKTSTGLSVKLPTSKAAAPPGYYMLFILNGTGVPSVGKFIRLH